MAGAAAAGDGAATAVEEAQVDAARRRRVAQPLLGAVDLPLLAAIPPSLLESE